ncbi:MAG: hypothetical protein ABIR80_19295 [Opitutaceae bacterium]
MRSVLSAFIVFALTPWLCASAAEARWWKGNLHTHSLWSDGDDYPEMIADWYKHQGYHFLTLSDHNIMQEGQHWLELKPPAIVSGEIVHGGGGPTLDKYLARFGADWVERRQFNGAPYVRLKPLEEYRARLEEADRFLLLPSLEVSRNRVLNPDGTVGGFTVHINVTNPRELVPVSKADDAVAIMQGTVDAVLAQRAKTGQPMFPHINHPNFLWGITPEELMQVRGEKFFEVYNGHAQVRNEGDATHASMDRLWDIVLTRRLAELRLPAMFGIGVDDSHHYHRIGPGRNNPGRGWVMVRAKWLTPESIVLAMEAGDFYASSGVTLADVRREPNALAVTIAAEPGVTYTTSFIGTRKGYDPKSQLMPNASDAANAAKPHRRYSADIGATLATTTGVSASYTLKGDEIYVRAKIVSSKKKENGSTAEEFETAWTQPLVNVP